MYQSISLCALFGDLSWAVNRQCPGTQNTLSTQCTKASNNKAPRKQPSETIPHRAENKHCSSAPCRACFHCMFGSAVQVTLSSSAAGQCASGGVDHAVHALPTACSGAVHVLHGAQKCPKVDYNMRCIRSSQICACSRHRAALSIY